MSSSNEIDIIDETEQPTSMEIMFLRTKNGEDLVSFVAVEVEDEDLIRLINPVQFLMMSYDEDDEDETFLDMRAWLPIHQMTYPSVVMKDSDFLFIMDGAEYLEVEFMEEYVKFIGWDRVGKEKEKVEEVKEEKSNVVQFGSKPKK